MRPSKYAPANRLISALPTSIRRQVLASCERVELKFAQVISGTGNRVRHVYFPLDSFVSIVTVLTDGSHLEVGIVGDEGVLGASLILGVGVSPQHAVVQGAGAALRMTAAAFLRHCAKSAAFSQRMNRYIYVLMAQLAQLAACTHYHVVEARLARWLLMTRDRAHSDEFHLTHEFLAYMLGVRRVGITEAASALQKRGLIEYSRGNIGVLNWAGLEKASCRCYSQGKALYTRTLGPASARARAR